MSKKNEAPKQPYQPPKLKDFGPVEQLTKGPGGGVSSDGVGGSSTTDGHP